MNLSKATIVGRVADEPRITNLKGSDDIIVNLRVLTNRPVYKNGKKVEGESAVTGHNLVLTGQKAKFAADYVGKGALVAADGDIQDRSYTGKDGETKYITEIKARSFEALNESKSS